MDQFAETTTIHGVGHGHAHSESSKFGKVCFGIIFVAAFAMTISQLVNTFKLFIHQDLATTIHYDPVSYDTLSKLNILICPFNWISHKRSKILNMTEDDVVALLSVLQSHSTFFSNFTPSERYLDSLEEMTHDDIIALITSIAKPYRRNDKYNFTVLVTNGEVCYMSVADDDQWGFTFGGQTVDYIHLESMTEDDHPVQDKNRLNMTDASPSFYGLKFHHYIPNSPITLWDDVLEATNINHLNNRSYYYNLLLKQFVTTSTQNSKCMEIDPQWKMPSSSAADQCVFQCNVAVLHEVFQCTPASHADLNTPICIWPRIVPDYLEAGFTRWWSNFSRVYRHQIMQCEQSQACSSRRYCEWWEISMTNMYRFTPEANTTPYISYKVEPLIMVTRQIPIINWSTFISNIGGQTGLWIGASMISLAHAIYYWIGFAIGKLAFKKSNTRNLSETNT